MANGTAILTLPEGYRPLGRRMFASVQGGNSVCRVEADPAGQITISGVSNNLFLSLDVVRFMP